MPLPLPPTQSRPQGNLILTRKPTEGIWIGETLVTVIRVNGNHVKLAINADRSVPIRRTEHVELDSP